MHDCFNLQNNCSTYLSCHEPKEEIGGIPLVKTKRITEDWIEECLVHTESKAEYSSTHNQEYQQLWEIIQGSNRIVI